MEHVFLVVWAWLLAGVLLCAWWPESVAGGPRWAAGGWAALPAVLVAAGLAFGWPDPSSLVPPAGYGIAGWGEDRWRLTTDRWPLRGIALVLLTLPFYVVAAWGGEGFRGKAGCLMGLGAAAVGAYSSQSLWGWLFWQYVALFCLWGLAGAWGREETLRQAAAARLLAWGLGGLTALTAAFLGAAAAGGTDLTFNELPGVGLEAEQQHWVLAALLLALAAYIPLFPLHTWLPGVGARAPLAAAAAVGLWGPMGLCGFMRTAPLLCADALAVWQPWLEMAAVASMLAGGLLALAQRDALRRPAYALMVFYGGVLWGIGALPASWGGVLGLALHLGLAGAAVYLVSGAVAGQGLLERVEVGRRTPLGLCWLAVLLVFCGVPGAGLYTSVWTLYQAGGGWEVLLAFLAGWAIVCIALLRPLVWLDRAKSAPPWHWLPAVGLAVGAAALALYPALLADYVAESPWPPSAIEALGEEE